MGERTLVFIKPDGIQRSLVGTVISRFEARTLRLVAAQMMNLSDDLIDRHYAEHVSKPFYPSLKDYMKSGPVLVMVWEGENVVSVVRKMVGATNPATAEPGTIRGDFALTTSSNIVHASDSPESAMREIANFFPQ
ncbi:MAG: nucleoside-diphosphate kinase [Candidatus Margulisiibacteriota bacterium]